MKVSNRLTMRYIVALSIIAALLAFAFLNLQYLVRTEECSASVINLSGRQRMLSQKAALLSLELAHAGDASAKENLRRQIDQTANLLLQSHEMLKKSADYGKLDDAVGSFAAALHLWAKTPDEKLTADAPEFNAIMTMAAGPLIEQLDQFVSDRQRESEAQIKSIRRFQTIMVMIGLLVLLGEAIYIFRPAVRVIERERKALETANEELLRLSSSDGLTGIANRRYFANRLLQNWHECCRDQQELSVILLDVDFFKLFNDTYGHVAGDDCLRQIAYALRETVKRPADLAARYGGEEFVVLLPRTSISGAAQVAENIRQAVAALAIPHEKSAISSVVTVSLGVACVRPGEQFQPEILVQTADISLYDAKRGGRNRVNYQPNE